MKMKKIFLAVTFIVLTFIGCNNELEINAPWKDVTVVYGLLDQKSDSNWVRIHRGYLGNEGVYGGNQDEDSIYYKNLIVTLRELKPNGDSVEYLLQKAVPSPGLDSGFFTTEGYHSYLFDQPLATQNAYKLVIDKPDGDGPRATATTPIVSDFNITKPTKNGSLTFGKSGQNFIWDQAKNGILYQGYLRFYYVEMNAINKSDSVRKYVDYKLPNKLGTNLDGNNSITVNVGYETFYRYLTNAIGVNPDVVRFFRYIDIFVFAAADDYNTYLQVNQPAQGIVQDKPLFTNINNGIGIFSSRTSTEQLNKELSSISIDSLVRGLYTCELMFGNPSAGDTCYCLEPGRFYCE